MPSLAMVFLRSLIGVEWAAVAFANDLALQRLSSGGFWVTLSNELKVGGFNAKGENHEAF